MYSRSNSVPRSEARWSSSFLCFASSPSGRLIPLAAAISFSLAPAALWSRTIRAPNSLTRGLEECSAILPASTSNWPPIAASLAKLSSAELSVADGTTAAPGGLAWPNAAALRPRPMANDALRKNPPGHIRLSKKECLMLLTCPAIARSMRPVASSCLSFATAAAPPAFHGTQRCQQRVKRNPGGNQQDAVFANASVDVQKNVLPPRAGLCKGVSAQCRPSVLRFSRPLPS